MHRLLHEENFFDRELSNLEFFRRVLDLAKDPTIPLFERLNYLFITSESLDQFFEMNLKDPVLRDIWLSISADKEMRDMDLKTSQYNADLVFESLKHLFPESNWPNLRRYFLLVANITPSTIRLALSSDPEDCPQIIEVAKKMISASLQDWAAKDCAK